MKSKRSIWAGLKGHICVPCFGSGQGENVGESCASCAGNKRTEKLLTATLAPCPWCGKNDELEMDYADHPRAVVGIRCRGCGEGPSYVTDYPFASRPQSEENLKIWNACVFEAERQAIELWNRRTPPKTETTKS